MAKKRKGPRSALIRFERRGQALASRWVFAKRLLIAVGVAQLLVVIALYAGMAGYHWLGGLGWVDSLLNASMILGGMGPVDPMTSNAAKIFASFYALFSGLFFIAVMGIVLAPVMHRIIHRFHVEDKDPD